MVCAHGVCAHLFSFWLSQILYECNYSSFKLQIKNAMITNGYQENNLRLGFKTPDTFFELVGYN